MKYNLNKSSGNFALTDDKVSKSETYNKWMLEFVSILEEDDFYSLKEFVKRNISFQDFSYFLMSTLSYVKSIYNDEKFNMVLSIIQGASPNLRANISEYRD